MALPTPQPSRTAIVTGASSGIGVELARNLAERGHGVTLVARSAGPLQELADELSGRYSIRAEVVVADLTEPEARVGILHRLEELELSADLLLNNAGFSTTGPVYSSEPDREIAMIRTDVEAVAHLCSLFLPGMVERRVGAVLNVASTAAFQPIPGQAGYGASKAFVLSYSHGIAAELRGTGVTVTVLCPGPVRTGFADAAGITHEEAEAALSGVFWVEAAEVARQGIEGLAHGRPVVIPGRANQATAYSAWLAPRRILLPLLARQHPALKAHR